MTCSCHVVFFNGTGSKTPPKGGWDPSKATPNRNWRPECEEHGTASEWWNSDEQVKARAYVVQRTRVLFTKAAVAKELGVGCTKGDIFHDAGECAVCDEAMARFMAGTAAGS